jgi:RNA polymerase sigma-70 factor (ECF subfamily)
MDQILIAAPATHLTGNLPRNIKYAPARTDAGAGFEPSELEQHRTQLTRYAQRFLGNQDVAQDAVQDTLLAALQAPLKFEQRSAMRTWLFGILKHKIMDAFRRQSREVPLQDDGKDESDIDMASRADPHWHKAPSRLGDPEQALNQKRFLEVLELCMERLPANTARVFRMREVMGMNTKEICAACGITQNNCLVILHRARNTLRTLLEERDWSVGSGNTPRAQARSGAVQ